jgi:hypothetical protein
MKVIKVKEGYGEHRLEILANRYSISCYDHATL